MRRMGLALAAAALLVAGGAEAGVKFAAYEGPDAIREGTGGSKITTDGVDFWTTGSPPRRYQVVGVLSDKRGTGLFSGEATGSGTAKRIRALGGDAAIIVRADTRVIGATMLGGTAALAQRVTTQMVVIRYLGAP